MLCYLTHRDRFHLVQLLLPARRNRVADTDLTLPYETRRAGSLLKNISKPQNQRHAYSKRQQHTQYSELADFLAGNIPAKSLHIATPKLNFVARPVPLSHSIQKASKAPAQTELSMLLNNP
jgi:hypothetical protein